MIRPYDTTTTHSRSLPSHSTDSVIIKCNRVTLTSLSLYSAPNEREKKHKLGDTSTAAQQMQQQLIVNMTTMTTMTSCIDNENYDNRKQIIIRQLTGCERWQR